MTERVEDREIRDHLAYPETANCSQPTPPPHRGPMWRRWWRPQAAIGHRVGEVSALHIFHSRLDRGRVEEVALDDFCTFLAKLVGPGIEFVDKCANGKALLEEKRSDDASG